MLSPATRRLRRRATIAAFVFFPRCVVGYYRGVRSVRVRRRLAFLMAMSMALAVLQMSLWKVRCTSDPPAS
jgi:hypothetical protein